MCKFKVFLRKLRYWPVFVCITCLILPLSILSQENGLESAVGIMLQHDDNIFRTNQGEVDDSSLMISPEVSYTTQYGKQAIQAEYNGNYVFFEDNETLDYLEHDLSLTALFDFSQKFKSEISGGFLTEIEAPGETNAVSAVLDDFTNFENSYVTAELFYGTSQSIGQFVVQYAFNRRKYDNNNQEFRDYDSNAFTGTFYYRVAKYTRLFIQGNSTVLSYENNSIFDASSEQNNYLAGVELNVTPTTNSIFRVGYQDVTYDSDLVADLSGLSYYLDSSWQVTKNSLMTINASRAVQESAEELVGGYISSNFSIGLNHTLTYNTTMSVSYSFRDNSFEAGVARDDKTNSVSAGVRYQSKRWLSLYAEYILSRRDSNLDVFNYRANSLNIGVQLTFN